jgi:predicted flap endonuclease-1-like 5' DNA nuclease
MTQAMQTIEANWMIFGAVLALILAVGWMLYRRASSAPKREYKPDVLDQGAASVQRNQSLIDAPPAAAITSPAPVITPPAMAGTLGGVAEAVAIGAQDVVEEAAAAAAPPPEPLEPAPAPQEPVPEPAPAQPDPGPQPAQTPTPEPQPAQPTGAASSTGDDLSRIKGLGPKLQALLPTLGLNTYAQIAALDEAGLADLDSKLGAFAGRPAKDNWVEQARYLAEGDVAGFEGKFGKV